MLLHQELNQEICSHTSDLKALKDCGDELCKHGTTEDATKLGTSLNEISQRYHDLDALGKTRLEQMREVPGILERFHDVHNSVLDWMQQIETELNQCEVKPGLEAELKLQVKLETFCIFKNYSDCSCITVDYVG
jgi:hypothetical protein